MGYLSAPSPSPTPSNGISSWTDMDTPRLPPSSTRCQPSWAASWAAFGAAGSSPGSRERRPVVGLTTVRRATGPCFQNRIGPAAFLGPTAASPLSTCPDRRRNEQSDLTPAVTEAAMGSGCPMRTPEKYCSASQEWRDRVPHNAPPRAQSPSRGTLSGILQAGGYGFESRWLHHVFAGQHTSGKGCVSFTLPIFLPVGEAWGKSGDKLGVSRSPRGGWRAVPAGSVAARDPRLRRRRWR